MLAPSPASERASCGLGNVSPSGECGAVVEVSRDAIVGYPSIPNIYYYSISSLDLRVQMKLIRLEGGMVRDLAREPGN